MKFIQGIEEGYSSRLTIAGGKGANLHKLKSLGFNVPDGFIVNTKAFDKFLLDNDLVFFIRKVLDDVRINDSNTVSNAAKKIKQRIEGAHMPDEVLRQLKGTLYQFETSKFSVRSSGVFEDNFDNSWAGQFDSFLQINRDEISNYIKKCWASFFNARAISYNIRAYKNVAKLKFAVVVQEMVQSKISGVAFSIEPKENDFSKILIEATPGLGENLVSGRELSFSAIFDKKKRILLSKHSSLDRYSNLLSFKLINLLAWQVVKLEKLYKKPVDIEWAIYQNRLYFLQIRPITGLERKSAKLKRTGALPDINDYELTFKVSGLSFLFTDMLAKGFKYLNPLFTSDEHSQFCQYFTNEKMEYAAKYGVNIFGKPNGFREYQEKFTEFYEKSTIILDEIIERPKLTKTSIQNFFKILSQLFTFYSKMDNQFTNLAYIYADENRVIKKNLQLLSKFKDRARLWINNSSIEDNSQLSRFIKRICLEFNIERLDLECYKMDEVVNLFYGSYVRDSEIANRRKSFTIYYLAGKQFYITGKRSLDYTNSIAIRQNLFFSSEIKGKVANKVQKNVHGKVRLINVDYGKLDQMNKEIDAMQKGEILVSEFTAPELIAACRKARAIVTDIGGLLSHAAIVSRELNIPCLVGTHNATKVLKTGDEIDIDFDLGIVNRR